MINKYLNIALVTFLVVSCSNVQNYLNIDIESSTNLSNYNEFSINLNEENFPPEVNPIKLEKFKSDLIKTIENKGLKYSEDANLTFNLNVEIRDKIESEFYRDSVGYYHGNGRFDRHPAYIKNSPRIFLRINAKDISDDSIKWTMFTSWNVRNSRSPINDVYMPQIIEAISSSI